MRNNCQSTISKTGKLMLRDPKGWRKYVTPAERDRFIIAAQKELPSVRTFCLTIAFTGCRISEALELCAGRVDIEERVIVFRSLKKRRADMYRSVPVPPQLLKDISHTHKLSYQVADYRLWPWCRGTGWMHIKRVMATAEVVGPHACPKGLRHGLAIVATQRGVPLNLLQRWLGHSSLETTAIYAEAIGPEERKLATRLW
ncbi:tyrosine-type recombinase/integrase [Euryhalocaulis caribicus]|uniref:tyrosine-type recombinase/integrase n=1 Tax=Euryhalocaulis caribicus TaxID=1161401 RepID=UPI0019D6B3DC